MLFKKSIVILFFLLLGACTPKFSDSNAVLGQTVTEINKKSVSDTVELINGTTVRLEHGFFWGDTIIYFNYPNWYSWRTDTTYVHKANWYIRKEKDRIKLCSSDAFVNRDISGRKAPGGCNDLAAFSHYIREVHPRDLFELSSIEAKVVDNTKDLTLVEIKKKQELQ